MTSTQALLDNLAMTRTPDTSPTAPQPTSISLNMPHIAVESMVQTRAHASPSEATSCEKYAQRRKLLMQQVILVHHEEVLRAMSLCYPSVRVREMHRSVEAQRQQLEQKQDTAAYSLARVSEMMKAIHVDAGTKPPNLVFPQLTIPEATMCGFERFVEEVLHVHGTNIPSSERLLADKLCVKIRYVRDYCRAYQTAVAARFVWQAGDFPGYLPLREWFNCYVWPMLYDHYASHDLYVQSWHTIDRWSSLLSLSACDGMKLAARQLQSCVEEKQQSSLPLRHRNSNRDECMYVCIYVYLHYIFAM